MSGPPELVEPTLALCDDATSVWANLETQTCTMAVTRALALVPDVNADTLPCVEGDGIVLSDCPTVDPGPLPDPSPGVDASEVTADDCNEGNVSSLSLMCASRDNPADFMPSPALGGSDHMAPTANYTGPCTAGNPGGKYCQTDNRTLTVFRESTLSASGKTAIAWTLDNSYDTTNLNVVYPSTASYSGDAETDIIYRTKPSDLESGVVGIAWCNDRASSTRCDQHYISFRFANVSYAIEDVTHARGLACHETGHTVGLTHGEDASPSVDSEDERLACMKRSATNQYLGTANAQAIQTTYN